MKFLIDTHLLLWAASDELPQKAVPYFTNDENELYFSSASIWEIVIKNGLNRPDFNVDPVVLYKGLLDNGYKELPVNSRHTFPVAGLPPIHKDPFDRILIAQAKTEGMTLLTSDKNVSLYCRSAAGLADSPVVYVE